MNRRYRSLTSEIMKMHYILNREKILIDHSQNKQDFIYISENLIDKLNVEKDDNSKRCITYYFLKRQ